MPKRIQRKRTEGATHPPNTHHCTRPLFWSNPLVGKNAAKWFRLWLREFPRLTALWVCKVAKLAGDDLAVSEKWVAKTGTDYLNRLDELREFDCLSCACKLNKPCHVDTLIDGILDRIYDWFDDHLRNQRYGAVNRALISACRRAESYHADVLIAYLTVTLPARSKLPSRRYFFRGVEAELKRRGEWEPGLLDGLE